MRARRAIALFLPTAVLATALCGLIYAAVQQDLRSGANDPQIQLSEDAATRLDQGEAPADVVGNGSVDVATSLAPFVVVYDPSGAVLATDGELDGHPPMVPIGVLDHAREAGRNAITWQPAPGIRVATVTVPWSGGTVLVGRSLRVVEERVDALGEMVGIAWLVTLAGIAFASAAAAAVWPERKPGDLRDSTADQGV